MPNELPNDLPASLVVVLREDVHNGRKQLTASFQKYKLIIIQPKFKLFGADGEEWEVIPENSPNGHVIFCRLHSLLKVAPPSMKSQWLNDELTGAHASEGFEVEIRSTSREWGTVASERGPLVSRTVDCGHLRLSIGDGERFHRLTGQTAAHPAYVVNYLLDELYVRKDMFRRDLLVWADKLFVYEIEFMKEPYRSSLKRYVPIIERDGRSRRR